MWPTGAIGAIVNDLAFGEGISAEAVPEILRHRKLRALEFHHSELTDRGVNQLADALPELKGLWLMGTLVSGEKIAELELGGLSVQATN